VASRLWPDIQRQRKIDKGVFSFSSAGHGGVIAILGEADLPPEHVAAAREVGLIETVCVLRGRGRGTRGPTTRLLSTAEGYSREQLVRLAEEEPERASLLEAWVGEEDVDWAMLFLANPALAQRAHEAEWLAGVPAPEEVRGLVQSWKEEYLAALEPDYVPQEDGPIRRAERRRARLDAGERLLSSASGQGDGTVHATFRGADGSDEVWEMSNATYDAVSRASESVTPEDYRPHGDITRIS
jgi:hypothetical protein